jgi:Carboxypeptidase regulatory-like domain/TonB dependent receptor/TonB-dependent Receptor Plug Domain
VKRILFAILAVCLFVVSPLSIYAQFETASVLGYVHDTSGAVVSGATVSLINQDTKAQVTVQTNAQGAYEFTDVKIGQYQVTAQGSGFDTSTTQTFTVTVNARQRVDVSLKIGSNTETVTVNAAAALLETDSSERGQVIGTREVENLPLNGRAYADLAALVPGVRRNVLENTTDSSRDATFNVNGQRSEFNNFLLDGLDNNAYGTSNQGFSNQAIPPSPDAISEFRVETDNYSAEYGRSAGAVVNVSIRSGTNQFHGKGYDYLRNTVLNAIGPFTPPSNPLTGKPQKPILIRNQFGGTFGGPIWKDHTFAFGDYEGTRQVQHNPMSATLPTANQNGTSALAIANGGYTFLTGGTTETVGSPVQLINPLTGKQYNNGIIPFNDPSISSFAKGVLAALPQANLPSGAFSNNYVSLPPDVLTDNKFDVRVDQTFSARTTAFVRYSQHHGAIQSANNIEGPAGGSSNGNVNIFNQQIAGGVTRVFNQNSILDGRFAFTRTDGGKFPYGQHMPSLMAGIPGLPPDPTVARSLNSQSVSGFSQFGNQGSNPQFQDPYIFNPKINYTQIHGRSTYKVGYEYQAIYTTIDDFNPTYGQDTYNGGFSFNGIPATSTTPAQPASSALLTASNTGIKEAVGLADFLFGARDTYQLNNFVIVHLNQRMNEMYFQDDIRVNSRLTVNAGLRYELVTPQWESSNKLANYDPGTQSLIQAKPGSIYNRALVNMPKLDFAPRLGLAYSITPKTVVRAGYGLGYAQFNREGGENMLSYNLPAIVNTNSVQAPQFAASGILGKQSALPVCTAAQAGASYDPANPNPCFRTMTQGYPTNFTNPANVTAASNLNVQARYIPKDLPTGYVQSWHLTVQRDLGGSNTLEVAYVGQHGVKLETLADLNQSAPNAVTATCNTTIQTGCLTLAQRRPIPTFTTIEETLAQGFLSYNGLQTKFEHRTGHGLYLLNSFTWSRAIDNASGHLDANDGDNSRINLANSLGERGPSGYNQPLNETLSLVYDLPYGKGRMFGARAPFMMQEVLGGWQVTAINSANSGLPVNITYSPTAFQQVSGLLAPRPNQNGNPVLPKSQRIKLPGNQNLVVMQNPVYMPVTNPVLSLPTPNQPYGNAGRNSVRFDPLYQLDLGLHKNFPLYPEGVSFDFRAEAFNVLNQTNYAFPQSGYSPTSSSFGVVAAASTFPARVLQFAGKIIF